MTAGEIIKVLSMYPSNAIVFAVATCDNVPEDGIVFDPIVAHESNGGFVQLNTLSFARRVNRVAKQKQRR